MTHKIEEKSKKWIVFIVIGLLLGLIIFFAVGSFYLKKTISDANTNLKIGVVTDFEFANRNRIGNKLPKEGRIQLEKIVDFFNKEFQPEIVIEAGDMIESSTNKTVESAQARLREINEVFSRIEARREYVLGNHDLRAMNKEEFRSTVGMEDNHKYFDLGDWRFVLMDTNFDKKGNDMGPTFYAGSYVSDSEFSWLREALNTDRPTLVFSHHPPLPQAKKNLINGEEVCDFFEQFDNIVMVVSGHHPNFELIDSGGITYLVVDNIANKDSLGSFATLEASYNKYTKKAIINLEHFGPKHVEAEIKKQLPMENAWYSKLIRLFE
jgi:predicted phosphodiesterase